MAQFRSSRQNQEDTMSMEALRDFCRRNHDEAEFRRLEALNFMVGQPFPGNYIETEEDWERIEREAENSDIATIYYGTTTERFASSTSSLHAGTTDHNNSTT